MEGSFAAALRFPGDEHGATSAKAMRVEVEKCKRAAFRLKQSPTQVRTYISILIASPAPLTIPTQRREGRCCRIDLFDHPS